MRFSIALATPLVIALVAGCDTPPPESSASVAASPAVQRAPVFVDRTKQVPFDRGRARLGTIRTVLLTPGLTPAQTTGLGFECASLRSDQLAVAKEQDPIVVRFVADVDKLCGLDVPLAAAYAELRAIDAKRAAGGNLHSECLGLKVALGDFAPKYLSNPAVATIGGKYATYCHAE
jgi:hypothetical protein